jgi:ribonuclease HI
VYEISFNEFLSNGDDGMGDAKSVTSATSSGKRKRTAGPAFYAVRVGRTPGVYYSWRDCEAEIRGVKAECELPVIAV